MDNEIGNAIRAQRLKKGMSQEKLAAAAGGRNVTQINAYERGRSRPTPRVLAEIAEALGVSSEELISKKAATSALPDLASLLAEFKRRIAELTGLSDNRVRVHVELS